jgi:hypothetical protein
MATFTLSFFIARALSWILVDQEIFENAKRVRRCRSCLSLPASLAHEKEGSLPEAIRHETLRAEAYDQLVRFGMA